MLASAISRKALAVPSCSRQVAANAFKKKAPQAKNYKTKTKKGAGQQFDVKVPRGPKKTVQLGFTKANELFVGRLAMIGFALAVLGEATTGKGALAQLNVETGVPIADLEPAVIILVLFNLVAALLPASGRFEEEEDDTRQKGSLQDPRISLASDPKRFLGISGFGFTKANELFVGRVAQLGFAAALIGEAITGKGPLEQLDIETGLPLNEIEPLLLVSVLFTFFAAINEGSGRFVPDEK